VQLCTYFELRFDSNNNRIISILSVSVHTAYLIDTISTEEIIVGTTDKCISIIENKNHSFLKLKRRKILIYFE
jgi:hypothetical protein